MVYILQISPPLHHARFYVGFCEDSGLDVRLKQHVSGQAARLTSAAVASGRQLSVVAVLPGGDRLLERSIKNRKSTPKFVDQIRRKPGKWVLQ